MKKWQRIVMMVLSVVLVFLTAFTFMTISASAANKEVEIWQYGDAQLPKIPSVTNYPNVLIYRYGGEDRLILAGSRFDCIWTDTGAKEDYFVGASTTYILYKLVGTTWTKMQDGNTGYGGWINQIVPIYCSNGINYQFGDKGGQVFFPPAPNPPTLVKPFQIVETVDQLAPVMETIVGLIPLLLPLLVGWISLYKAWMWLKTQLVGA